MSNEVTPQMMLETIQTFHDKIDKGFNRVYDALTANKKELSQEIDAVSRCVEGHQVHCVERFQVIEAVQVKHEVSIASLEQCEEDRQCAIKEKRKERLDWGKWFVRSCLAAITIALIIQALDRYLAK